MSPLSTRPSKRHSRLTSWLENMKRHTSPRLELEEKTSRGDENRYTPRANSAPEIHNPDHEGVDRGNRPGFQSQNFFDSYSSFRRRLSSLVSSSSKRPSISEANTSHPPTCTTTPRTSISAAHWTSITILRTSISTGPRASFPCVCRMPTCVLCQNNEPTESQSTKSPGNVKVARCRAELAKRKAIALDDEDAFSISIVKSAGGFTVSRDYASKTSAIDNLTPRTARFRASLERNRSTRSQSWPRPEPQVQFEAVDYKADKAARHARLVAEKERWRRESELTGSYFNDVDCEGVAPEYVSQKRQEPEVSVDGVLEDNLTAARRFQCGYDIFVDENERGFLGKEPL